jgi:hypothetical protein
MWKGDTKMKQTVRRSRCRPQENGFEAGFEYTPYLFSELDEDVIIIYYYLVRLSVVFEKIDDQWMSRNGQVTSIRRDEARERIAGNPLTCQNCPANNILQSLQLKVCTLPADDIGKGLQVISRGEFYSIQLLFSYKFHPATFSSPASLLRVVFNHRCAP